MRLRAALAVALAIGAPCALGGGSALEGSPSRHRGPNRFARDAPLAAMAPSALCVAGSLPDLDGTCVRIPGDDDEGAPASESAVNSHRDRRGRWVVYDQIPRRPDRPADYAAYRYPVDCEGPCVVSGYDLDRPDEAQRRGARLRAVGHGAVDIAAPRGTPVSSIALDHQQGPAEVVFVGWLFGHTVVTRHTLHEGSETRDYLLFYGHLDATAPSLRPGSLLREGDAVGLVGDSGSPGVVHLHLEARRVRPGKAPDVITAAASQPSSMVADSESVVCDPRNVLPLR